MQLLVLQCSCWCYSAAVGVTMQLLVLQCSCVTSCYIPNVSSSCIFRHPAWDTHLVHGIPVPCCSYWMVPCISLILDYIKSINNEIECMIDRSIAMLPTAIALSIMSIFIVIMTGYNVNMFHTVTT